jgi:hypothetical protein
MNKPTITETHTRTVRMTISKDELEKLILNYVLDAARFGQGTEGLSWKIIFQDEMRGSPEYRVGTKAVIEVNQDMNQLPKGQTP